MNLRKHVRTLGAAALVLAVVGVSAGHVEAKPRQPKDARVRCVYYWDDGYIDFYLPGEHQWIVQNDGVGVVTVQCGQDGRWHAIDFTD